MSTRRDSLDKSVAEGKPPTQQERILTLLDNLLLTRAEIAETLGISTQATCARLNELVKLGKVEAHGTSYDPETDRRVSLYRVRAVLATQPQEPV